MADEADIEKAKGKKKPKGTRRRSARVYVNANRPLAVPLDEIAEYFPPDPPDDDDDGQAAAVARPDRVKRDYSQAQRRRLAADGKALPSGAYPIEDTEDLHNAAVLARTGHGDVEAARRLIARRAKELGVANPLEAAAKATGNPYDHPGVRSPAQSRASEPLTAGHASPSSGDHGVGAGRSAEAAWRHPDMREGSTTVRPWQSLTTRNPDTPDADIIWGAGRVAVDQLHTTDTAQFTSQPSGNPNMRDYSPHSARGSAVPPNGSHSLSDPRSHAAPQAMKGSDALRIMRETQNRGRR